MADKEEKSFWKKLASTVVEFEEEKVPVVKPVTPSAGATQVYVQPQVTTPVYVGNEVEETFRNILKEKNLPGVDYYEFIMMKAAMAAIPIESVKYTSAFAGLQVQGLTKDILLSTAERYKTLIQEEVAGFNGAFAQQYAELVDKKKAAIEQKAKQMNELSQQIAALNEEIKTISEEVAVNEQKLTMAKNKFESGGNNAILEIDKEISNINNYIN